MPPTSEQLYSYLTGLAPAGEEIWVNIRQLCDDLQWDSRFMWCKYFIPLEKEGVAERVAPHRVRVLVHFEDWKRNGGQTMSVTWPTRIYEAVLPQQYSTAPA